MTAVVRVTVVVRVTAAVRVTAEVIFSLSAYGGSITPSKVDVHSSLMYSSFVRMARMALCRKKSMSFSVDIH